MHFASEEHTELTRGVNDSATECNGTSQNTLPGKTPTPESLEGITASSCFTAGYLLFLAVSLPPPLSSSFPPNLQEQNSDIHLPHHSLPAPLRPTWDRGTGAGRFPSYLMLKKVVFPSKSVPSTCCSLTRVSHSQHVTLFPITASGSTSTA